MGRDAFQYYRLPPPGSNHFYRCNRFWLLPTLFYTPGHTPVFGFHCPSLSYSGVLFHYLIIIPMLINDKTKRKEQGRNKGFCWLGALIIVEASLSGPEKFPRAFGINICWSPLRGASLTLGTAPQEIDTSLRQLNAELWFVGPFRRTDNAQSWEMKPRVGRGRGRSNDAIPTKIKNKNSLHCIPHERKEPGRSKRQQKPNSSQQFSFDQMRPKRIEPPINANHFNDLI